MSSKYEVNRQVKNGYEMCLIKLENGKKCLYWNHVGAGNFKKVIVIFNRENAVSIQKDEIGLSFEGINNKEDLDQLLIAFGTEVYKNKVDISKIEFKVIVDSKDEINLINDVMAKYKLKSSIEHSEKFNQLTQNLEDAINNIAINSKDSQITKEDNNQINKYLVHGDKIFDDNDTLSIAEKKKDLLEERMKDPEKASEMSKLSVEDMDKSLTDAVTSNLKTYHMEDSSVTKEDTSFERVSNDVARQQDNKVNDELGIIRNNPSSEHSFSTVERSGNSLNVVNPTVSNATIKGGAVKNNSTSGNLDNTYDHSFWDDDNELSNGESRGVTLPVYYFDYNTNEIYNERSEKVGTNGVGGYLINEDNNLLLYGKVVGQISDVNDLDMNVAREKANVRVYKPNRKNNYYDNKKEAGSISLPIIIFIISLFLLVGSGIILYLMK